MAMKGRGASDHVLIVGLSSRAAAESAARAGFTVTAIDAFADLDQHASVCNVRLPRRFTAQAAARAGRSIECDAVAYLSNFENHPGAVSTLASGRALWGNPPDVLQRVRNPMRLSQALSSRGLAAPGVVHADESPASPAPREPSPVIDAVGPPPETESGRWLVKPLASGGGHRVQLWGPDMGVPRGCYLQELIEGTPGSAVFVASGGRAVLLAVSRQLVGEDAFGTTGYRYCGNILAPAGDRQFADDGALVGGAAAIARAVSEEFGLVGVNGVDFVVRDGVPHAIEVNPRWSASMELVERAYGLSVFGAHAAACAAGDLPPFDFDRARLGHDAIGKAIVFTRWDVEAGDTGGWLGDPSIRDVPRPGQRISVGRPFCTVFATGRDGAACRAALVDRAERVYAALARWERGAA
jgi:predicted ATP-grasp superfamily ATP-dependent carboligase